MEKKILLLLIYVGMLAFVKHQGLMEMQENRGFYIDNIDLSKEAFFEATICQKEETLDLINQKRINS